VESVLQIKSMIHGFNAAWDIFLTVGKIKSTIRNQKNAYVLKAST